MSGGIIQLNCSKENNIFLNCNPEITFFKKKYKRHTNFGTEFKYINTNSVQKYGNELYYDINIEGDLLHSCFLEINIPKLSFTDSVIDNVNYDNYKSNLLNDIQLKINEYDTKFTNFNNFSSIEIIYYTRLLDILDSDNVTVTILQNIVTEVDSESNSGSTNIILRDTYKVLIDSDILNLVDVKTYINNLDVSDTDFVTIKNNLNTKYDLIQKYLKFYFSNKSYQTNLYNTNNNVKIKYAWSKNLAHYYFSNFRIEMDGTKIDSYDSDQLNIFQSYNVDNKNIYNKMTGNTTEFYNFTNDERNNEKLYVPLIFWFCRDSSKSLPLLAAKKSLPKLYFKINNLKNILYFKDWESEYNNLLILDILYDDHQKNVNNSIKSYSDLIYENLEIILPEYIYRYTCTKINKKFLDLKFPGIDSDSILNTYGTEIKGELILEKNNYIYMMNNLSNNLTLSEDDKIKLAGYHYFIDYDYLFDNVNDPDIKLLGEFIYLDNLERDKFCNTKLEYLIELFSKEEFEITEKNFLKFELKEDILLKNLFWYVKPKNMVKGLFDNCKLYNGIYNGDLFYENKIISEIDFIFNNYKLLGMNEVNNYYNILNPYEYLNNEIPDGVNFINFSIYPKNSQPSGSFNLSKIKNKVINLSLNKNFFAEYYDNLFNENSINPDNENIEFKVFMNNYNILIFDKLKSRLIFYHK